MTPRIILLTLATVLLLSCSTDETIKNQLIIEAMKTETKTVTNHIAGVIQMNAAKFDCEIIEIGLAGETPCVFQLWEARKIWTLYLLTLIRVRKPQEFDPEQIRTRLVEPDATAGTRYCRTLLEVDAIQVRRDNLDDLLRFTGGGTMTITRTPNGRAVYSFPDGNGIFIDAPETYYIVREPDGRLTTRPEREFNREFEPKGVSVPKEQR